VKCDLKQREEAHVAGLSNTERNMMRQDAMRRAQEMRRQGPQTTTGGVQAPPPPKPAPPPPTAKSIQNPIQPLQDLLGTLNPERALILGLLFLLAKEGADIKLLAALGYVLM